MRIAAIASGLMLLALGITSATVHGQRGPALPGLTLTTTAFEDGGAIPPKFTQSDPKPISPKLDWTNVPTGTVTFVLIMHDPEAVLQKKSEDALHWIAFNIPGTARGLPEGVPADAQLADGTVQPNNVLGRVGYLGPGAPPAGPQHHYTWDLCALDTKLELGPGASRADVLKAMDGHVLGRGVLVGRFHR